MSVRSTARSRPDGGFTLVELLMTIVVVGIISLSFAVVIHQYFESVFYVRDDTQAVKLARDQMELVRNLDYDSVVNAGFPNYQGYNYDVTRTVSFFVGGAAAAESLKEVHVQVTRAGDPEVLIDLAALLARNVQYGP